MPLEIGQRILGIDPGLNTTGYGVLEMTPTGPTVPEAGVIRSTEKRDPAEMEFRLRNLYDGIVEVLEQYRPQAAAVEQLYSHYDHPRTAILMAHARGAIFLALGQRGVPVMSYAATRIKRMVTGSGRADKDQMQRAVQQELRLPSPPEPNDVADALAAALCHYFALTRPESPTPRGLHDHAHDRPTEPRP